MGAIKQGDVVQLKSGGSAMTVEGVGDYSMDGYPNGAKCSWFVGNKAETKIFDVNSLKPYEPKKAGLSIG